MLQEHLPLTSLCLVVMVCPQKWGLAVLGMRPTCWTAPYHFTVYLCAPHYFKQPSFVKVMDLHGAMHTVPVV